jgi:hypothetical protein
MSTELHIHIQEGTFESPEDLLAEFPFEGGQSIVSYVGGVVVIDMAGAEDTSYVQDWFLNDLDEVSSYYVVED